MGSFMIGDLSGLCLIALFPATHAERSLWMDKKRRLKSLAGAWNVGLSFDRNQNAEWKRASVVRFAFMF